MHKKPADGVVDLRPFLVLEVCLEKRPGRMDLCSIASIPGRESVSTRRWRIAGYLPDEAQVTDLAAYVSKLVMDATKTYLGVQRSLNLD